MVLMPLSGHFRGLPTDEVSKYQILRPPQQVPQSSMLKAPVVSACIWEARKAKYVSEGRCPGNLQRLAANKEPNQPGLFRLLTHDPNGVASSSGGICLRSFYKSATGNAFRKSANNALPNVGRRVT